MDIIFFLSQFEMYLDQRIYFEAKRRPGYKRVRVRVMVFNTTFNNISAISWRSVLLVEETGVPGEKKTTDPSQVTDTFCHIMLHRVRLGIIQ